MKLYVRMYDKRAYSVSIICNLWRGIWLIVKRNSNREIQKSCKIHQGPIVSVDWLKTLTFQYAIMPNCILLVTYMICCHSSHYIYITSSNFSVMESFSYNQSFASYRLTMLRRLEDVGRMMEGNKGSVFHFKVITLHS